MIRVEKLSVHLSDFALDEVSFEAPTGQCLVCMGATGSGKTTLLETICGLRRIESGRVWLMGREVTSLPPAARGVGFVPQEGALFNTMSVAEHLAFGPRIKGWPRQEVEERVVELADELGIAYLLDRHPPGLSGGERQRVALGRALAARPSILALDEPVCAVDEEARDDLCQLVKRVTSSGRVTTLYVTHSQREAKLLGDCILRLMDGRLETFTNGDNKSANADAASTVPTN